MDDKFNGIILDAFQLHDLTETTDSESSCAGLLVIQRGSLKTPGIDTFGRPSSDITHTAHSSQTYGMSIRLTVDW